ncbi:MAG: hypothetical protein ACAI38_10525 [Myxococcota bacterium]|nr:hypothetical protein [Myxococcota bacterium]
MDSKIDQPQQSGLRVDIDQSRARQAPKTDFGSVLSTGLSRTTNAVLNAGQLAAPYIPGGAVLSAAISGVGTLKSHATGQGATGISGASVGTMSSGGGLVTGGGAMAGTGGYATGNTALDGLAASGDSSAILLQETKRMQELNQSFNLQYLGLQQNMQADNRQFTTLSNIMKTKHDTAKNSINNVR